jgi:hypothetical protein
LLDVILELEYSPLLSAWCDHRLSESSECNK